MNAFRLGWRNLWRNGRRTAITLAAVALNTAILIALYGLIEGMVTDMVHNATHLVAGVAQVHAPDYRAERSFYKDIPEPQRILDAAGAEDILAAPRSFGYGLVSVGDKSAGAEFWGVDPAAEKRAFELAEQLDSGVFLVHQAGAGEHMGRPVRQVVLGRKLAKSLHAEVGTEVVAVVQAADGSPGNELFTVSGILKTCGEQIDRSAAIIHRRDFRELFVSGGRIHEIALNGPQGMTAEQVAAAVESAAPEMEVLTWRELMPSLSDMVGLFDAAMALFGLVFFLAAGLGVLNTMLMATFERMREFGVLKAIGATPWRILRDVSAEALVMGMAASAIGVVLGLAAMLYLHFVGIDLRFAGGDITFSGVAFDPIWKSTLNLRAIVSPVLIMWIVCLLAALYPAAKAARIDPVRAMSHV